MIYSLYHLVNDCSLYDCAGWSDNTWVGHDKLVHGSFTNGPGPTLLEQNRALTSASSPVGQAYYISLKVTTRELDLLSNIQSITAYIRPYRLVLV